ncbi:MAG: general secretion pathway protein M [Halieaceae bacterium]
MTALWQRFGLRDQISLLILAGFMIVYIAYMVLWSPLDNLRDEMIQRNFATSKSLQQVDAMVSQIIRLRDTGGAKNGSARRNLTAVINQSTRRQGLAVSRLQPNSRGEIQVRLEAAVFDDLMSWLHAMEYSQSLLVLEVSLTQAGDSGRVNATVRIGQAG